MTGEKRIAQTFGALLLCVLEHDAEKLHDVSDYIMRPNKGWERNGDPD